MKQSEILVGHTYRAQHGGTRLVIEVFPASRWEQAQVQYRVVSVSRPQDAALAGTEWAIKLRGFARWAKEEAAA